MGTKHFRLAVCAAIAMLGLVGCHLRRAKPPVPAAHTVYQSPNLSSATIRRVLLLPVANQTPNPAAGHRFYELLASEISSTRCFETIRLTPPEAYYLKCETDMRYGRFSERSLIEMRNTFYVDAVLFASLKDFHAYWPPRFSASLQMVDTSTGETVWSVDGVWDARNENVSQLAQRSFKHSTTGQLTGDTEIVLQSPEYLGKFVACQMAQSLERSWPRPSYPTDAMADVTPVSHTSDSPSVQQEPVGAQAENIETPAAEAPMSASPLPADLPQPSR